RTNLGMHHGQFFPRRYVIKSDRVLFKISRSQHAAVGRKTKGLYGGRELPQCLQECTRNRIPDLDRVVLAGRRQELAVRTENHVGYSARMSSRDEFFAGTGQVPEVGGVPRGRNEDLAILAKLHGLQNTWAVPASAVPARLLELCTPPAQRRC